MKVTLTALGDVAVVGGFLKRLQSERPEEVFDPSLLHLLRSSDACIANVECVLTESDNFTIPGYGLRTSPDMALVLRSMGISIATLANNHIRDVGDPGVLDSISHLKAAGMQVCGAGENEEKAAAACYFSLQGIRFGLLAVAEREDNLADRQRAGAYAFSPSTWTKQIAELRDRCDVVLVSVHAGHEFSEVPSPRIRTAYREAIDAGAHVVLAHHPHVVQGVERHRGGIIFYSLGNFCFDSNYVCSYPGWDIGIVPQITFTDGVLDFEIHPIKIRRGESVRLLPDNEKTAFQERLTYLSQLVRDDESFAKAWRRHVKWRFEQDYLPHLQAFGERLRSDNTGQGARFYRNYFACPTHQELIADYLTMRMQHFA